MATLASDGLRAAATPGLRGRVAVPGDKSISHRALILGGLAEGETRIEGLLEGQDVLNTARAVAALGAEVEQRSAGSWWVRGGNWRTPEEIIDCGNSGTGVRLLMGAVAGFPIEASFTGDSSLRSRPMERVLGPLRQMGLSAEASEGGRLPVTIRGGGLKGISFVNEKASAQVKSAILLAGLSAEGRVEVIEPAPTRDHSENMLRAFGCEVEIEETPAGRIARLGTHRILRATDVEVPGDPSSAAFPLVAALITPNSEVTVANVMMNPLRIGLLTTLREMGADLDYSNRRSIGGEEVADITARTSHLRGVEVPAGRAPSMIDEYPILAVAAAFAEGPTRARGLAELRVKESDRLAAIAAGLRACGVIPAEEEDALTIFGSGAPPSGGATVTTHGDHRIAMSFLALGLASRAPVTIDEAEMIGTSFPGFAELMQSLGAHIENDG